MSAVTRPPRWAERVLGFCLGSSADQRTILGDVSANLLQIALAGFGLAAFVQHIDGAFEAGS